MWSIKQSYCLFIAVGWLVIKVKNNYSFLMGFNLSVNFLNSLRNVGHESLFNYWFDVL